MTNPLKNLDFNIKSRNFYVLLGVIAIYNIHCALYTNNISTFYSYYFNYPTNIFIVHGILFIFWISKTSLLQENFLVYQYIRFNNKFHWLINRLISVSVMSLFYVITNLICSTITSFLFNGITKGIRINYDNSILGLSFEFTNQSLFSVIFLVSLILFIYLSVLGLLILAMERNNFDNIVKLLPAIFLNVVLMGISSLPNWIKKFLHYFVFLKLNNSEYGIVLTLQSLTICFSIWAVILIILLVIYLNHPNNKEFIKINVNFLKKIFDFKKNFILFYFKKKSKHIIFLSFIVSASCILNSYLWNNFEYIYNKFYIVEKDSFFSHILFLAIPLVFFVMINNYFEEMKEKFGVFIAVRSDIVNLDKQIFLKSILLTLYFFVFLFFENIFYQIIFFGNIGIFYNHIIFLFYLLSIVLLINILYLLKLNSFKINIIGLIFLIGISFVYNEFMLYCIDFVQLIFVVILIIYNRNRRKKIYAL